MLACLCKQQQLPWHWNLCRLSGLWVPNRAHTAQRTEGGDEQPICSSNIVTRNLNHVSTRRRLIRQTVVPPCSYGTGSRCNAD